MADVSLVRRCVGGGGDGVSGVSGVCGWGWVVFEWVRLGGGVGISVGVSGCQLFVGGFDVVWVYMYTGYEVQSSTNRGHIHILSSRIQYPSEAAARTDDEVGRRQSKVKNEAQEAENLFNAAVLTKTV